MHHEEIQKRFKVDMEEASTTTSAELMWVGQDITSHLSHSMVVEKKIKEKEKRLQQQLNETSK